MYSESNKCFLKLIEEPPISSSIMETNIYKNDKNIDYICYVEGPTDTTFYGNLKNCPLSNKKIEFISMPTSQEGAFSDEIGKEGVISRYFSIYRFPNYKKLLSKSIFIIDHDFEGLTSEKYDPGELDETVFTITKPYAFENYFLTKSNLQKIFSYFNLSSNSYYKFEEYLNKLVYETSTYTRLKSSVTIACKKGKYKTYLPSSKCIIPSGNFAGRVMEPKNIFHFDFLGKYQYFYNRKFLNIQNEKMKNSIKNDKKILDYYNNISIKFKNKIEYTRGHDIFNMLETYLMQIHNINISQSKFAKNSRYKEIVRILDVDIDFVNGHGERIL